MAPRQRTKGYPRPASAKTDGSLRFESFDTATESISNSNSTSTLQPRSSVRFRNIPMSRSTLRRCDYTPEEIRATWFSRRELRDMVPDLKELKQIARCCSADDCIRGLEHQTKKGIKLRRSVWVISGIAVMDEQDYQREDGIRDDEALAQAYSDYTQIHQKAAHWIGLTDEAYVRAHVCEESTEMSIPPLEKSVVRGCEKLKCFCQCHVSEPNHDCADSDGQRRRINLFKGLGLGQRQQSRRKQKQSSKQ
uniref:Uncharacterized protein n=1 Tax=Craspedostauros australis TaxID=1486917 RepID=A0A7R9ZJA2_9STRA|mmetsp:Transcript_14619/g.40336  ORF Transcript_14619/g.40336 Transcript_14619/m.40336 type:complete len:250 (+) Transcript_14619:196-945(+)